MKAMNVYYDPNDGQYFKINKQTGIVAKSHRNGAEYTKFKAQYSGSNYQLRKKHQTDLSPPSITKPPYRVSYEHKHTIPYEKKQKIAPKSMETLSYMKSRFNNSFRDSRMTSAQNQSTENLAQKMKDYSRIKQNILRENHSSRTNILGSLPSLQPVKQYTITDSFKTQNLKYKPRKKQTKSVPQIVPQFFQLPSCLQIQNQLQKERQIFRKYNAERVSNINDRNEKEMIERKKNLKILEKLNLNKHDKITSQVYECSNND